MKTRKLERKQKKPSDKLRKPIGKQKNRSIFDFSPKFQILIFVLKSTIFFLQFSVKSLRNNFWFDISK
jgi:hypothetical protein